MDSGDLNVLSSTYSGKNISVKIDCDLLTNKDFIKNACLESLSKVAEAIQKDVVDKRKDVFADKPGENYFSSGAYPSSDEYYESGKVPYWRGGLLGSFQVIGKGKGLSYDLAFTSPYASLIEEGGISPGFSDDDWFDEKLNGRKVTPYLIKTHHYTSSVAYTIQQRLEDFGYLDVFCSSFISFIR